MLAFLNTLYHHFSESPNGLFGFVLVTAPIIAVLVFLVYILLGAPVKAPVSSLVARAEFVHDRSQQRSYNDSVISAERVFARETGSALGFTKETEEEWIMRNNDSELRSHMLMSAWYVLSFCGIATVFLCQYLYVGFEIVPEYRIMITPVLVLTKIKLIAFGSALLALVSFFWEYYKVRIKLFFFVFFFALLILFCAPLVMFTVEMFSGLAVILVGLLFLLYTCFQEIRDKSKLAPRQVITAAEIFSFETYCHMGNVLIVFFYILSLGLKGIF